MPTKVEILRDVTHKDDKLDVEERVYRTLVDANELQLDWNSRLLASLMSKMKEKGMLSEGEIDDILYNMVSG